MFCRRVTIQLKKPDDVISCRPLGDIHLGNLAYNEQKFLQNVDFIHRHEDHYTIGMGDYIDNVMAFAGGQVDKRWNPETVDRKTLTTEEQTDAMLKIWKPIAHKTWGLLAGNHEWKTINQRRFIKDFCEPLGIPYLGRLAYIYLTFKHKDKIIRNYLILALHGGYNGLQAGGAVNRLKQIGADFDADVVLMGHNHDSWTRTGTRIEYDPKTNNPIQRKILYANTGTFLESYAKGVDGYVEINPREARRVGTITVSFSPYDGGIHAHD